MGLPEIRLFPKSAEAKPVKVRIIRDNATKEIMVVRGPIYPTAFHLRRTERNGRHPDRPPFLPAARRRDPSGSSLPRLAGRKAPPLILDLRGVLRRRERGSPPVPQPLRPRRPRPAPSRRRAGAKEILACPEAAPLEALPVILWIDQTTMGPAEIVAACLRESPQGQGRRRPDARVDGPPGTSIRCPAATPFS